MHSLAQRPRSKCPSCYFVALFDVFVRADDRKKNFLCSARTSLALFGKKRDLTRVDRRPRGRGGAGDKNGKGGPSRRVPRCWCSTPASPASLLCRGVVSVRPARHAVFVVSCGCACVFFVFGFLPNGLLFFFFSMPSHNTELFRPQLVATRTKRRNASLSEFARGEQPHSCVGLFRSLRAHFPRCHSLPRNN